MIGVCARAIGYKMLWDYKQALEDHMGAVCLCDCRCLCTIVKMFTLSFIIVICFHKLSLSFLLRLLFFCGWLVTTVFILFKYKYDNPTMATVFFQANKYNI